MIYILYYVKVYEFKLKVQSETYKICFIGLWYNYLYRVDLANHNYFKHSSEPFLKTTHTMYMYVYF